MSRLALVVAKSANNVIGNAGSIPWRISDDLRHFRSVTMGKPCIMGRRTWESLPKKPLPGRMNIVVTRNSAYCADGAVTELSLAAAIARARAENTVEIAVIGGAEIYRESLSLADMIYLTEIHAEFEGDAYFPELESSEWFEVSREEHESPDAIRYAFVTLRRRNDAHATGN